MINNEKLKNYISNEYKRFLGKFEISNNHLELIKDIHSLYEYIFREIIRYVIACDKDIKSREILVKYESEKNKNFQSMLYGQYLGLLRERKNYFFEKFIEILEEEKEKKLKLVVKSRLRKGYEFGGENDFSRVRNDYTHMNTNNDMDDQDIEWLCKESKEGLKNLYFGIFEEEIDDDFTSFQEIIEEIENKFKWLNNNQYISAEDLMSFDKIINVCKCKIIYDKPMIGLLRELYKLINRLSTKQFSKELHNKESKINNDEVIKLDEVGLTTEPNMKEHSIKNANSSYNNQEANISLDLNLSDYRITGVSCFNKKQEVNSLAMAVKEIMESLGEKQEYKEEIKKIRDNPIGHGLTGRFFALTNMDKINESSIKKIESLGIDIVTHYSSKELKGILIKLLKALKVSQDQIFFYGVRKC